MTGEEKDSRTDGSNSVLTAVRLGWLVVETFGRLKRYHDSSRGRTARPNASRRFAFSDRSLNRQDELLLAMDQLRHVAAQLVPELQLDLPASAEKLDSWLSEKGLDDLHHDFEEWSKRVWVKLATGDELTGRAFTFGGSLADTYWHAEGQGVDALKELLRSQRLEYIANRFETIAEYLPACTAGVLRYTLYKWRIEDQLEEQDMDRKKRVLDRLASQTQVWRNLLFGNRQVVNYLTAGDRRLINWGVTAATAVVVLAVIVLVWRSVLFLSSTGRGLAGVMRDVPVDGVNEALAAALLDWQKWSVLLATLSSVAVFFVGITTRLSGWISQLHSWLQARLQTWLIHRRTYRHLEA